MYKIHYYDISRNSDSNVECELDPNATADELFDLLIHNQWIAPDQIYQIRNMETKKVFLGMRSFKDMVDRPNARKEFRVEKWTQPVLESREFQPPQALQSIFMEEQFMPPSQPAILLSFTYGGTVVQIALEKYDNTTIYEMLGTLAVSFELDLQYCSLWNMERTREFTNIFMPIQETNKTEFELVYRKPSLQSAQQKQQQQQNLTVSFNITRNNETKSLNIPQGVIRVSEFVQIIQDQNLFKMDHMASRLMAKGRVFCNEQNEIIDSFNERQFTLLCPWPFYEDEYITIQIHHETQKKSVTFSKLLTLNDIAQQDIFNTGNLNYVYTDEKGQYLSMNGKLKQLKDKQIIIQRIVTSLSNPSSPLKQQSRPQQKVEQPSKIQKKLNLRYKNEVKSIDMLYGLTIQEVIVEIETLNLFKLDKSASRFMAKNRVFIDEQSQLIENFQETEFTILCPWRMYEDDYLKIKIQEFRTKSRSTITFAKNATLQQLADLDLFDSKQGQFAFTDTSGNAQKMTNIINLTELILYQGNDIQVLQNINKISIDIHYEQRNITLFIDKNQHFQDITAELVQKNFIQHPDKYRYMNPHSQLVFPSNDNQKDLQELVKNGRIILQIQLQPQIIIIKNPNNLNRSNPVQVSIHNIQQQPQPVKLVQKLIYPDGSTSQEITIVYNGFNYQQAKTQLDSLAEQYQRR